MSLESPPYSQSPPAPSYSAEPLENEERLEYTSRPRRHRPPTGKFTISSGGITLVLNEQDGNATVPLYRQNGLVCGSVSVENCKNIASLTLKLEGRLQRSSTKKSSDVKRFVSEKYTIWPDASRQPCPPVYEFAFLFPSAYKSRGRTRPLPPSYNITLPGGFAARCVYTLSVFVTKPSSRLTFWGKSQTLTIGLDYCPRTCPSRPILHPASLFLTVKSSPEEWFQICCRMQGRPNYGLQAIICNLFIPSVQTYGISDTIPFHLQLSGPLSSLRALCPCVSSTSSDASSIVTVGSNSSEAMSLRVFLSREITVEVFGQRTTRTTVLGEATCRPLPPVTLSTRRDEEVLDWEGEVRCADDVSTGGFFTETLVVRDFIVLSLTPPHPQTSPLIMLRHAHPIRLATDSWTDLNGHPQDR